MFSMFTPNHEKLVTIFPKTAMFARPLGGKPIMKRDSRQAIGPGAGLNRAGPGAPNGPLAFAKIGPFQEAILRHI